MSNELALTITADPNVALCLLGLGALGIYAEFCAPGRILPGVIGSTLALLGIASLRTFPIAWPGALLMVLAFALFVLEARFVSRGLFTTAGAAALLAGSKMLITNGAIHWLIAILIAIPFSLITSFLLSVAARARRNKAAISAGDMLK